METTTTTTKASGAAGSSSSDGKQFWKKNGIFLASTIEKDVNKIVLDHLLPDKSGMEVYRIYLRNRLSMWQDMLTLSQISNHHMELFYGTEESLPPRFFSLFTRPEELSSLEYYLNMRIILLRSDNRKAFLTPLHDRSVFDIISDKNMEMAKKKRIVFVLEPFSRNKKTFWRVYLAPNTLKWDSYKSFVDAKQVADVFRLNDENKCIFEGLARLLKTNLDDDLRHQQHHTHGIWCKSLCGLLDHSLLLSQQLNHFPFTLISHLGSPTSVRTEKQSSYVILLSQGKPKEAEKIMLCVSGQGTCFFRFKDGVKPTFKNLLKNIRRLPGIDSIVRDHFQDEETYRHLQDVRKRKEGELSWGGCLCQPCINSLGYVKNIKPSARSKLYTHEYSLFDLLRFFGKYEKYKDIILQACDLSLASFDTESACLPAEGGRRQEERQDDQGIQVSTIGSISLPRNVFARHKVVLIGYLDHISVLRGQEAKIFGSWPGSSREKRDPVHQFLDHLLRTKEELKSIKRSLLSELFEWVEKEKATYFSFYSLEQAKIKDDDWTYAGSAAAAVSGISKSNHDAGIKDNADADVLEDDYDDDNDDNDDDDDDKDDDEEPFQERKLEEEEEEEAIYEAMMNEMSRLLINVPRKRFEKDDAVAGGDAGGGGDAAAAAAAAAEEEEEKDKLRFSEEALMKARNERIEKLSQGSWDASLMGKLEKALIRLTNRYIITAFNGESFDFPLIVNTLLLYAKELNAKGIRLQRQGSKIKSISISGIELIELTRLLTPGFSLENLGKTCGLEGDEKCRFPFALFTSSQYLAERRLPADSKGWENNLDPTAECLSQREIDKANEIFDQIGAESVGEYLCFYLKKDCNLTLKSSVKLMRAFYQLLGLHPAQSGKFTVSSLASMGVQSYLFRQRRIGFRFCNDPKIFSVRSSPASSLFTRRRIYVYM